MAQICKSVISHPRVRPCRAFSSATQAFSQCSENMLKVTTPDALLFHVEPACWRPREAAAENQSMFRILS
eukprot:g62066.t1